MLQIVDARSLHSWIKRAKPGDSYIYHEGLLMRDRQYSPKGDVMLKTSSLSNMANRIYSLYEKGMVDLYQKRVGDGLCHYIMVRK